MKSRFILIVAGFVVLGFLLGVLYGCESKKRQMAEEPVVKVNETTVKLSDNALNNIKTAKVSLSDFPERLSLMGRIGLTEDRMTVVPSRVAGRIDNVFFASGESVNKGQVLVSLFSPDFVAAKEEYLLSLKQSGPRPAAGDNSDFASLARMARKRLENMGLSPEDIDALPKSNPEEQSHLLVRSPRSGVLVDKKAVVGNLSNVGDPLFTIADISKVWFTGDLYPEDVNRVHKDQEVVIEAAEKEKLYGRVSFISPVVDPTARTIKIRALIDNSKLILKADMYVQGFLILNQRKALAIPNESLIRLQNQNFVFKLVDKNHFERIAVDIEGEQLGFAAIKNGLKDGEVIVTEGALLLSAVLNASQ